MAMRGSGRGRAERCNSMACQPVFQGRARKARGVAGADDISAMAVDWRTWRALEESGRFPFAADEGGGCDGDVKSGRNGA